MRVSADGFIHTSDGRRVRTPGNHTINIDPLPEAEALSFLLSHSFPGHRRIIRGLSLSGCRLMRLAAWADSVSERMAIVDRVWRSITEPVAAPLSEKPKLIQVVQIGAWAYPIHVAGSVTRVLPPGGVPMGEVRDRRLILRLDRKSA